MSTAIAILAAGRGSRLGGDASKPLLEWRGRPLVAWAAGAALDSGLRPVLVVVGYRGNEVRAELAGLDVQVVDNPEWSEGIASSLRAALAVLSPMDEVTAVCVGLADQPLVGARAYELLSMWTGGEITVARYDGQPGNPVKLARSLWPEAMELRGDAGARVLMRDRVVDWVDCTDTGSAADVDTLEDLERLQQEDQ
ncbi:MAG TPA: nucleotidyltransferase family protein [Acidimicrobiia bacterium]